MHNSTLILYATSFAIEAHKGQLRKYTGMPYIQHPVEVATLVAEMDGTTDMICAALLHDVVEDTEVTLQELKVFFGDEIATLVGWLTDVSKPSDGNRAIRKALDREHSFQAPAEAQTVKVADFISNFKTITKYDRNFSVVYMREMELLLNGLTKADPMILTRAFRLVDDYYKSIDGPGVSQRIADMAAIEASQ